MLQGSVMDRKGIPECAETNQRVSGISVGCSDKVVHIEYYYNISIPGTNKASAESVTWTSKMEI